MTKPGSPIAPALCVAAAGVIAAALTAPGCGDWASGSDCPDRAIVDGFDDGFRGDNTEEAGPSDAMLEYTLAEYRRFNPSHQISTRFDETLIDRAFGHTVRLGDIDYEHVVGAELTIPLRVLGNIPATDEFRIVDEGEDGSLETVWSTDMSYFGGGEWNAGDRATVVLDLADMPPGSRGGYESDLMDMLADGQFHIYIQDDTAVDYVQLTVSFCADSDLVPR